MGRCHPPYRVLGGHRAAQEQRLHHLRRALPPEGVARVRNVPRMPRKEPRPVRQERVRPASFLLMQHINTSIERLNISILDHIYLTDRLIHLNIFFVSALRMCGVTKPRWNKKKQKTAF